MHIKLSSLIICSVNDNLTNTSSTPLPEGKKTVLYILRTTTETSISCKFNDKIFNLFKHQIKITVVLLSCGSFFKNWSAFWVYGVFKCNKLAAHFKLTLDLICVVLYKYLNCTADKTIDAGETARTAVTTNYRIILLMMLLITSLCKPLKIDPFREMCVYAT